MYMHLVMVNQMLRKISIDKRDRSDIIYVEPWQDMYEYIGLYGTLFNIRFWMQKDRRY